MLTAIDLSLNNRSINFMASSVIYTLEIPPPLELLDVPVQIQIPFCFPLPQESTLLSF
jgi:hypothetical protein